MDHHCIYVDQGATDNLYWLSAYYDPLSSSIPQIVATPPLDYPQQYVLATPNEGYATPPAIHPFGAPITTTPTYSAPPSAHQPVQCYASVAPSGYSTIPSTKRPHVVGGVPYLQSPSEAVLPSEPLPSVSEPPSSVSEGRSKALQTTTSRPPKNYARAGLPPEQGPARKVSHQRAADTRPRKKGNPNVSKRNGQVPPYSIAPAGKSRKTLFRSVSECVGFMITDPDTISSHVKKRRYLECLEEYVNQLHQTIRMLGAEPPLIGRVSSYTGLKELSLWTLVAFTQDVVCRLNLQKVGIEGQFTALLCTICAQTSVESHLQYSAMWPGSLPPGVAQ